MSAAGAATVIMMRRRQEEEAKQSTVQQEPQRPVPTDTSAVGIVLALCLFCLFGLSIYCGLRKQP